MEFQATVNFLDKTSDDKDLSKFVTKKWIDICDYNEEITVLTNKLELKNQC